MEAGQLLSLVGAAVTAAILGVTIKKQVPQIALLLTLAAGVFILLAVFESVGEAVARLREISGVTAGMEESFAPMLKVTGIAVLSKLSSQVCLDAGERALASEVELAGMAAALTVTLPLAVSVIRVAANMM